MAVDGVCDDADPDACSNHADLNMIAQMGISPERSIRDKTPSLRSVALMVIASLRIRRRQEEWARTKLVKESLVRTLQQTRKKSRRSGVV